jgi:hypothetical protein
MFFVASFQFIEDYRKALDRSVAVLCPKGKIIILLLNPESLFFKERSRDPDSYVSRIRHTDLKAIEYAVAKDFEIHTEHYLHINGSNVSKAGSEEEANAVTCPKIQEDIVFGRYMDPAASPENMQVFEQANGFKRCGLLPGIGARLAAEIIIEDITK